MSPRDTAIHALLARARATGKAVFGFTGDKASCAQVGTPDLPTNWNFACVEGDTEWTVIPAAEAAAEEAA